MKARQFSWHGSFSRETLTILAQHAVQGKLTGADAAMAKWLIYSHTHRDLPLSYSVFTPILEKLKYAIESNLFLQDEVSKQLDHSPNLNVHQIKWPFFLGEFIR